MKCKYKAVSIFVSLVFANQKSNTYMALGLQTIGQLGKLCFSGMIPFSQLSGFSHANSSNSRP